MYGKDPQFHEAIAVSGGLREQLHPVDQDLLKGYLLGEVSWELFAKLARSIHRTPLHGLRCWIIAVKYADRVAADCFFQGVAAVFGGMEGMEVVCGEGFSLWIISEPACGLQGQRLLAVLQAEASRLKGRLCGGLSTAAGEAKAWPQLAVEALSACYLHQYGDRETAFIPYEKPAYARSEVISLLNMTDMELVQALVQGDFPLAKGVMVQLFGRIKALRLNWADVRLVCRHLCLQVESRAPDILLWENGSFMLTADQLLENLLGQLQSILAAVPRRTAYEHQLIRKVQDTMMRKYRENVGLADLAGEVHLTPAYLSNLFRRITGTTLTDYMMDLRIAKAKELLESRIDLKAYEIGGLVGYPDATYFNRIFRKRVGITPKQYRTGKKEQ